MSDEILEFYAENVREASGVGKRKSFKEKFLKRRIICLDWSF